MTPMQSIRIPKFLLLLASMAMMIVASSRAFADPASSLVEDVITPVARATANRAAQLTVANVTSTLQFGATHAPTGRRFLVVGCRWENIILLSHIAGAAIGTEYKVPDLADNLYLVADDKTVYRLWAKVDESRVPGALKRKDFRVTPGSPLNGVLLFDLPVDATFTHLQLRFYDFSHGPMSVDLVKPPQTEAATQPLVPVQKNEVLEAGVFGFEKLNDYLGKKPPTGMRFAKVDLRARSLFTTDGDATAFDPKAKAGQKIKVGTVSDWTESRKYLQLIVDGEFAISPLPESELPAEPRFLPDLLTGGTVVFLVPENATSLELRCDFPNAKLPNGKVVRTAGLTFPLEGQRPVPPARSALANVKDSVFDISIFAQAQADEFAGVKAAAGKKFLIHDVVVKNLSPQQEFYQTIEQLKHLDERGVALAVDKVTFKGPRRPLELIYIPSGEQRTFQLVFQVAAGETKPRLAYASVTQGGSKALDLPVIDSLQVANIQNPATGPVSTQPVKPPAVGPNARATPVLAKQNHKPQGLTGVGLTPDQVNLSIDRGSKALWEWIGSEDLKVKGSKFGAKSEHILVALALVNANAHKKIPEFDSALRAYLKEVKPRKLRTYDAGLLAMLIEAYGDSEFAPQMEEVARHLLESQGIKGTWTYMSFLPDALYARVEEPKTALPENANSAAKDAPILLVRRSAQRPNYDGDNSNTQYAILGLHSASRTGIKISPDIWRLILQTTFDRQENSGGWNYHEKNGGSGYGSMTAAGICAVALCRHELGEIAPAKDEAIEFGLGWLNTNFSVTTHPRNDAWQYYYLYSIERVGRILDTEFIGTHEWYPLGAQHLLSQQKPTGLWIGKAQEGDTRLASSFALLFLTRATPSLSLVHKLHPPATLPVAIVVPATRPVVVVKPPPVVVAVPIKPMPPVVVVKPVPPPTPELIKPKLPGTLQVTAVAPFRNFYIILDASGSMMEEMDGKVKFDIARDSVRSLVQGLPAGCNVALRVYGHRRRAIEANADDDTELRIPMAPLDRQKFNTVLDSLRARGKTPLSLSVEQAATDLNKTDAKNPVVVLLLTDGGEDTQPRRDPLKAAERLGNLKGIQFHIVGFDINQPGWSDQLLGMAKSGGGHYWPAARAADLERGIRESVLGIPEQFVVVDASNKEVVRGKLGKALTLPEGKYILKTMYGGANVEREFTISSGATATVVFDSAPASFSNPASTGTSKIPVTPTTPTPRPTEPVTEIVKRFCSNCGTPLQADTKFCTKCGTKVNPSP